MDVRACDAAVGDVTADGDFQALNAADAALDRQCIEECLCLRSPYVLGDFVWSAIDYLGEAGIGAAGLFPPDARACAGAAALGRPASLRPGVGVASVRRGRVQVVSFVAAHKCCWESAGALRDFGSRSDGLLWPKVQWALEAVRGRVSFQRK